MSRNERKRDGCCISDAATLSAELDSTAKQMKLTLNEMLRQIDRFGKQLPSRLLASILTYVGTADIARSQTVCNSWKLPPNLLDRVWRSCYEHDWEVETSERKEIAVAGAVRAWRVRYERRKQTELNWLAGRCRMREVVLPCRPV